MLDARSLLGLLPLLALSPTSSGKGSSAGGAGATLFDSTLGADSGAGIDTGAAGIASGSRLLLVAIVARTDEVIVHSQVNVTFNNDGSAIYDRGFGQFANVTASANNNLADTRLQMPVPGASQAAGVYSTTLLVIPAYTDTTAQKSGLAFTSSMGTAAANTLAVLYGINYRSTAAISRMKILHGGGTVLKAGTRLTIIGL
jgi:hypothetical protein